MPFISRGVTVSFVRADEKPLAKILEELVDKKFTGRVEFNVVCDNTNYVGAVELNNGEIVAAELEHPALIRGLEALQRMLNRWIQNCRGYAEIIELTPDKVAVDLEENPTARIDPAKAREALNSALETLKTLLEGGTETAPEELAPTAPLLVPTEEERARPAPAPAPAEKPAEAAEVEETGGEVSVEAITSSEELIERLDSPLFDATIVLKGSLADSGYIQPGQLQLLLEKLVKLSKEHPDKAVVTFINDRMNEIKGKIVAHDGVIVATLVKKNGERLTDKRALDVLNGFERPLLYDVYLVGENVDETLYRLAQRASQEAKEAAKKAAEEEARREEQRVVAGGGEERREEKAEAREEKRRRRFFIFFRR